MGRTFTECFEREGASGIVNKSFINGPEKDRIFIHKFLKVENGQIWVTYTRNTSKIHNEGFIYTNQNQWVEERTAKPHTCNYRTFTGLYSSQQRCVICGAKAA